MNRGGAPVYIRDGFRPNGPGRCICPYCRTTVPTNALGRASHLRGCPGLKKTPPPTPNSAERNG